MNKNYNYFIILMFYLCPSAEAAEQIFLYKGTFSRSIEIIELDRFNQTKNGE